MTEIAFHISFALLAPNGNWLGHAKLILEPSSSDKAVLPPPETLLTVETALIEALQPHADAPR